MPGSATSRTYVFLNPTGRYQLFFYPGAASDWQPPLALKGLHDTKGLSRNSWSGALYPGSLNEAMDAGIPLFWQLKADVQAYPPEQLVRLASLKTHVYE